MAYASIRGTRIGAIPEEPNHRFITCKRCGRQRVSGGNSSPLCSDCRYSMSREEVKIWLKDPG